MTKQKSSTTRCGTDGSATLHAPVMRVIEECSELTQALCKADRFGWFNFHPDRPASANIYDVFREMNDVLEAISNLDSHLRELEFEFHETLCR